MKQLRRTAILAFAVLSIIPRFAAGAQVVAELMHRDSSSHLTLSERDVSFEFTRQGVDQVSRHLGSTTTTDRYLARLVNRSVVGVMEGIHIAFKLADIESADAQGATVYITFREKRSDQNTFDFDALDARSAQAFAKKLNDVLAERRR